MLAVKDKHMGARLYFMPGNGSILCGFPTLTAVLPYGAAFVGIGKIDSAKNSMCYFGP